MRRCNRRTPQHSFSGRKGSRRWGAERIILLALVGLTGLAGCVRANGGTQSEEEQLVRATLLFMARDGHVVCVDGRTSGRPLTVFRTMMANRRPDQTTPLWFAPEPLRGEAAAMPQQRSNGMRAGGSQVELLAFQRSPLPLGEQDALNRAAATMATLPTAKAVDISRLKLPAEVKASWWPLNRISLSCWPVHVVSAPIIQRDVAFISVTADHWGTTYAFSRERNGWAPRAQWTNWLY